MVEACSSVGVSRRGIVVLGSAVRRGAQRHESLGNYVPPPWAQWGDPDMNRKRIYVLDKTTGKLLREIELDGLSAAPPMTYLHRGKQYITVATGAAETSEVVALSLPEKPRN
jgi:hypothetical protein